MKRLVLNLIMAAGLLFAFSACQKEETFPDGDLQQITVNIPSVTGTRASISDYGTGSNVDRCILQVYRNDNKYGEQIVVPVTGGKATFNLRLVATHTYDFVFWADCSQDGGYYNTEDLTSITAKNYAGNNDKFDAFFYTLEGYKVTGPFTEDITLKRPFGQMNIVTTDLNDIPDADLKPTHVKVAFSRLPSAFNAKSGKITAYTDNVTYTAPVVNDNGELSVDYIFAAEDESTLADFSVEFLYNTTTITENDNFKNVPIRRNYKTNISGNLLTKEGIFDITVDPIFEQPDIEDFPELRAAFENGGNVTLDKDVTLDAPLVLKGTGKVVNIDLNGYDVINNVSVKDNTASQYGNTTVFEVKDGATLNIRGDGNVHAISTVPDEDGYRMAVYAYGNSTVNIYGGNFMNNQNYNNGNAQLDLIYADQNAVINIYGGTFESKCANSRGYWVLNLKDNSSAAINVYGGTFVNFDPSSSMTENPVKNFVVAGSTTVKISDTPSPNGTYEVVPQGEKVSVPIAVDNAEELESALENNVISEIIVTKDVDLSNTAAASEITFDEPKTITIENNATIKTAGVTMVAQNGLTITGGTIDNSPASQTAGAMRVMAAKETHEHKSLIHVYGGDLVLDGVTLVNDPDHHWHGDSYNTAAIAYWNDADVTIRNSHIVSGEFTLCGMGRGVASGVITLEDSYFESTSSNKDNGKHWAYAMRLFGSSIRIDNCEVKGIQGAISVEGCKDAIISSGKYYTVNSNGNKDAFYALYLTNDAVVTIKGGEFTGGNDWSGGLASGTSAVVSGDNDVDLPYGSVVLEGGKFSGKAYNHETKTVYEPASGYKWQEINEEGDLKWEVVPEE